MKYFALFTGVDYRSVIQFGKLFGKTGFLRQGAQLGKDLIIHLFGCIIICQAASHRNPVACDTVNTVFAAHRLDKIHAVRIGLQGTERRQLIKVFPFHSNRPPSTEFKR